MRLASLFCSERISGFLRVTAPVALFILYAAVFARCAFLKTRMSHSFLGSTLYYSSASQIAADTPGKYLMALGAQPAQRPGPISIRYRNSNKADGIEPAEVVTQYVDGQGNLQGAMLMAAGMILFLALRTLLPETAFAPVNLGAPVLVAALSLPLLQGCKGCLVNVDSIANVTRVGLVALPLFLAAGTWFRLGSIQRLTFAGICAASLGLQCYLLVQHPKFCFFCLATGLVLVSVCIGALAEGPSLRNSEVHKYWPFASSLLVALLTASSGTAAGIIKLPESPREIKETSLVGESISRFIKADVPRGTLLVVTIPGCPACRSAKDALKNAAVPFTETSFCGMLIGPGCFNTDSKLLAPLLLLVDDRGVITAQQSGWASSWGEQASIIRRMTPRTSEE